MIKIGIDFSINSTAVVINKNNSFLFFSFVPNFKSTLKGFKVHGELSEYIKVVSYTKLPNDKNSIIEQINKLKSAEDLSEKILTEINKHIDSEDIEFRIEGYSYGSSGNSFIDLIVYNTFLKVKLMNQFGADSIKVIPPKTNKKLYTGNGNANKFDMIKKFEEETLSLAEYIKEKGYVKEVVEKPLDDLVDAFALSTIQVN